MILVTAAPFYLVGLLLALANNGNIKRATNTNAVGSLEIAASVRAKVAITALSAAATKTSVDPPSTKKGMSHDPQKENNSEEDHFRVCSSWSKAGVGTCIVVESKIGTRLVFDIGSTPIFEETIRSKFVFISHGHLDHVGGIFSHARAHAVSCGGGTPTYFVPSVLVPKLTEAKKAMEALDAFHDGSSDGNRRESLLKMNIIGVGPGDEVALGKTKGGESLLIRTFRANHGGHPALGYIVCQKTKEMLKPEYKGLPGLEIRDLIQQGVKVKTDPKIIPQVTYTGDTNIHGILLPSRQPDSSSTRTSHEHLIQAFQSPLVLCELTFLNRDGRGKDIPAEFATERGHMHIQDVVKVLTSHGWDNDDNNNHDKNTCSIVFFHLSNRHFPPPKILDELISEWPDWLVKRASVAISSMMDKDKDEVLYQNIMKSNGCISLEDYKQQQQQQSVE